jgi:hypothetical protein
MQMIHHISNSFIHSSTIIHKHHTQPPIASGPQPFGPGTYAMNKNNKKPLTTTTTTTTLHKKPPVAPSTSTTAAAPAAAAAAALSTKPRPPLKYKPHTGKLPPYKGPSAFSLFSPHPVMPQRKPGLPKIQTQQPKQQRASVVVGGAGGGAGGQTVNKEN